MDEKKDVKRKNNEQEVMSKVIGLPVNDIRQKIIML